MIIAVNDRLKTKSLIYNTFIYNSKNTEIDDFVKTTLFYSAQQYLNLSF